MAHSNKNPEREKFIKDCNKILDHIDAALNSVDETAKVLIQAITLLHEMKMEVVKARDNPGNVTDLLPED